MPDGSPHSVAVWVGLEDGRIAFFTQPATQKAHNVERYPRVALSVVDHERPYRSGAHPRATFSAASGSPLSQTLSVSSLPSETGSSAAAGASISR